MDLDLSLKLIWLALFLLFAVVEGISVGLTSVWFAVGALAALLAAILGASLWPQIWLFTAVSLLCLLILRPLAKKYMGTGAQPTNADRVIGAEGRVTESIDNLQGQGAVMVDGLVWSARSADGQPIPAGTPVHILRIEGVKVYVEKIKEEVKC